MRHKRRRRSLTILVLAIILIALLVVLGLVTFHRLQTIIILTAEDTTMDEGGELPEVSVKVEISGNADRDIDLTSGYNAGDLASEFERGKGFTVDCDGDTELEGEYPLTVSVDASVDQKLNSGIGGMLKLVKVETQDGTLTVRNPVGTWDGDQFRTWDGDLVTDQLVTTNKKTYYFDDKGNWITGVKTVDGDTYDFGDDGAAKTNLFEELEGATYYFGDRGKALTGWQDIDGDTYYFLNDGSMVTGNRYVETYRCDFGEDGKLVSKEESNIDPEQPMVALTFDDGPGPRTMELLNALEAADARATFFMVGERVNDYKDTINKMAEIGCELGNHTYDHTQLTTLDAEGISEEVDSTSDLIKAVTGMMPTLVRPPYGSVNDTVKETIHFPLIIWNVDTEDWKTRNVQSNISAVTSTLSDGNIILMHDIYDATIDAALELIPQLQESGYQLVTVSELAAYKGVELENGETYMDFKESTIESETEDNN